MTDDPYRLHIQESRIQKLGLDLHANVKTILDDWQSDSPVGLIPTGFDKVDELLNGGLIPGDLMVVSAFSGQGKTAWATDICRIVGQLGVKTAFFTLEMGRLSLVARHVQALTGLDAKDFLKKEVPDEMTDLVNWAVDHLKSLPMTIVECGVMSGDRFLEAVDLLHEINKPDLIILDYLQLLTETAQNREQELSKICNTIRGVTQRWETPIILLCQPNRSPLLASRRPKMSDLKDSSSIEQMASIIAMFHPEKNTPTPFGDNPVSMDVYFDKVRMGVTGKVNMTFYPKRASFVKE